MRVRREVKPLIINVMTIEIKNRIFNRLLFYSEVHEKADSAKVANPAYDEMIVSIIELIYKFNGVDDLFQFIIGIHDDKIKLKIIMFLIQFDKERALKHIDLLTNSENESVAISANNIVNEKYNSIEELTLEYQKVIEKVALKRKLNISGSNT